MSSLKLSKSKADVPVSRPIAGNSREVRAVYIGTPDFSARILEKLLASKILKGAGFYFVGVITSPDRQAGRDQKTNSPPVKILAQNQGIPVLQFENIKDADAKEAVKKLKPDIMIMCAFGRILPEDFLSIPSHGIINIHYSLLPRWRGPSPIQHSLLNGDEKTGITLILTDKLMDHGPVIAKEEIKIEKDDNVETLTDKLTEITPPLLEKKLPLFVSGLIKPENQNEAETVYCTMLKKQDGKINWKNSSREIVNQIRAFKIWPGSYTYAKKTLRPEVPSGSSAVFSERIREPSNNKPREKQDFLTIKIIKARIENENGLSEKLPHGRVFLRENNKLAVKTGDGFIIADVLQLEGKKETDTASFLNGNPWIIGSTLFS